MRPKPTPRRRGCRRGACSSSTTIGTRRIRWPLLLRTLGVTVAVTYSGRAALEALATFAPDTVLLDIGMPDMDGYEASRRIRAQLSNDVLLVALTGWGQDEDLRQSRAAGFDHHLVKPPDMERLREILMDPASQPVAPRRVSPELPQVVQ